MSLACAALLSIGIWQNPATADASFLETLVESRLPALGHRNWIVVADSAYPLQTAPGIETISVSVDHLTAVRLTLAAVKKSKHVRPKVMLDRELSYVPESRVTGISQFRQRLNGILFGQPLERLLHEDIIAKLDEAGKSFRVLLIKTPHTQPYTSVFIQLECGYWSADAEKELRQAMKKDGR